jgi:TetR/AcrR family transcriptional regulator
MARPRASDHDDKRLAILERSAELFAAHGYDRVSVSMLARACSISKALLYHYFSDKSEVLFEIIRSHLEHLLAVTAAPGDVEEFEPRERLQWLATALLEAYRRADSKHHVQINQLHLLPRPQQKLLKDLERTLVDRFATAIAPCVPPGARAHGVLKPLTMALFGMLNWNYLWFREDGPMSRSEYAKLAVTLLVDGAARLHARPDLGVRAVS